MTTYLQRAGETPRGRIERIKGIWPEATEDDVIWVEPIGSRRDALLFWRTGGRVSTGTRGNSACFEGSLQEFQDKVQADYDARIAAAGEMYRATLLRQQQDYLAAAALFRSLC